MELEVCFDSALRLRAAILLNPSGALSLLDAVCLALLFLSLVLACFGFSYGECDGFGCPRAQDRWGGISRSKIHNSVKSCAERFLVLIACVEKALI